MKSFVFLILIFVGVLAQAKQSLVFLINTTERDESFGQTTPYLDEHYDREVWKKIFPQAKIITIRSDTNAGIKLALQNWMLPNPDEKEVVGLFVNSHGNRMFLANQKKSFKVVLPRDLGKVFEPIQGRLAKGARIVLGACSIVKGMNPEQAHNAMISIAKYFKADDMSLYANEMLGLMNLEILRRTDFFNSDIPTKHRALFSLAYIFWPIALPTLYVVDRAQNHGYLLEQQGSHTNLYQTTYLEALHPDLRIAKSKRAH